MVHKRGPAERASRRVIERTRSADTSTLVEQEPDLHDDPELGHSVVLNDRFELLGPDGLDVADRAGRALARFPDRILVALRGLSRQFDKLRNGHRCLPTSLSPTMVGPEPLEGNPLTARYHEELLWISQSTAPLAFAAASGASSLLLVARCLRPLSMDGEERF